MINCWTVRNPVVLSGVLLFMMLSGALHGAAADAVPPCEELKLLFSDQRDITNTWGKIHFGTSALQRLQTCENPGFELSYCLPGTGGVCQVYGLTFKQIAKHGDQVRETNAWSVVHATTRDGVSFENVTTLYEAESGPWTFNQAMTYNPEAKEFMVLKLKMDNNGFRYTAFFSPDGRLWKEYAHNPLFYDGDAISLFWDHNLRRYVLVSKSLQFVPGGAKPIIDHGNTRRRVLVFRTSPDGRTWTPSDSMEDVWDRLKRSQGGAGFKPLPDALLTVPDAIDPPDLEFYSGNAFWYHDRSYMMVLNYAASPLFPGKHAPQMDTEWWVGRDGLKWERPGRDVNALGDAFPGNPRITHNPMLLNGQILFRFGNCLVGMKQDRLSYVGARANAEFSTMSFVMPAGDLLLNAAVPSPDRPFGAQQAFVRVGVLDEKGLVIPGFEAEKCLIKTGDHINLPLLWSGRSARELAGKTLRLRFQLRSANIYAVTSKK